MEEKKIQTPVKGIYCIQCPQIIISGLLQLRGVIDADVEYFRSIVHVRYDPEILSEEEIFQALEEMGYPHTLRRPTITEQVATRLVHLFGDRRSERNG